MMAAGRLVTGVAIGLSSALVSTYISEVRCCSPCGSAKLNSAALGTVASCGKLCKTIQGDKREHFSQKLKLNAGKRDCAW